MTDPTGKLALLLVEDDTISRHFMQAALEALPARVDAVESAAQALALPGPYALWLIDAHLPDGSGLDLLAQLRARRPDTPALAHTADTSADKHAALRQGGFAQVLVKPLSAVQLQTAVRALLPTPTGSVWDEAAALRAMNGNPDHVAKLRQLFLDELPAARATVSSAHAIGDTAAQRAALHRLRASCGFVGASRLGQAATQLHADPSSATAMSEFLDASALLLQVGVPARSAA